MTLAALLLAGICCAVGLAGRARLRRRLDLISRAEHELRGPATALALACDRMRRDPRAWRHAAVLRAQLDRLEAGLGDLEAARTGTLPERRSQEAELRGVARASLAPWEGSRRKVAFGWLGGPAPTQVDRGAFAKALGNLIANAAEHGAGEITVRGRTTPTAVRIEIRNPNRRLVGSSAAGRGHGLRIAERAARDLGGRVLVDPGGAETVAVLELPRESGDGKDLAA